MRVRSFTAALAAALAIVSAASFAGAEQAPDVVRLKNGGMVRGTIRELVPGDRVEIVLMGGGTKTFKLDEVEYAGPDKAAAGQATAPAAPGSEGGRGSELAFRAPEPDLTLHQVTGSSYGVVVGYRYSAVSEAHSFRTLCTAPCTVQMAPGTYDLAISQGSGKPIIASRVVIPNGPSTAKGEYTSRTGVRVAGYVVLIAGIPTGLVMMLYGLLGDPKGNCTGSTCTYKINQGLLWGGLGVTVASSIVGTILASRPDKAAIQIVPGITGFALPGKSLAELDRRDGAALGSGLTLSAAF